MLKKERAVLESPEDNPKSVLPVEYEGLKVTKKNEKINFLDYVLWLCRIESEGCFKRYNGNLDYHAATYCTYLHIFNHIR